MNPSLSSRSLALISVLSALYVITNFIPISMFIGAQSFLSLSLIMTPIMAYLLTPLQALISSTIAGLILLLINPATQMFGVLTPLLPIVGATSGSILVHNKNQARFLPSIILVLTITFYLTQRPEFTLWIIPHIAAALTPFIWSHLKNPQLTCLTSSFTTTMAEQSAMLILAIAMLNLPTIVFQTAFPLMLYERGVATAGGTIVLYSIKRIAPQLIPTPGGLQ